jgi:hypothetical protein
MELFPGDFQQRVSVLPSILNCGEPPHNLHRNNAIGFDKNSFHELKKKWRQQIKSVRNHDQGIALDRLNARR